MPKLYAIRFQAPQERLADILAVRGVLELSSGSDCRASSSRSLHPQIFGEASPPIVNDRPICLVHVANLHSPTDYGVAASSAERRFRRFCRIERFNYLENNSAPIAVGVR